MRQECIGKEIHKVLVFRMMAFRNLIQYVLKPSWEYLTVSSSVCFMCSSIFSSTEMSSN
jgi:hypothetical protein